jgi:tetratricopeptide (TPR) repeat protein
MTNINPRPLFQESDGARHGILTETELAQHLARSGEKMSSSSSVGVGGAATSGISTVTIERPFGFGIASAASPEFGPRVTEVKVGGNAQIKGLAPGTEIRVVNGTSVLGLERRDAMKIILRKTLLIIEFAEAPPGFAPPEEGDFDNALDGGDAFPEGVAVILKDKTNSATPEIVEEFVNICAEAKRLEEEEDRQAALTEWEKATQLQGLPPKYVGFTWSNIGRLQLTLRKFEASLASHLAHVDIANSESDTRMRATAYTNAGIAYYHTRDYIRARICHENALVLYAKNEDVAGETRCFGNLGNAWGAAGGFREALTFHKEELALAKQHRDIAAEARASFNLENDCNSLKEYHQAEIHCARKRELAEIQYGYLTLNGGFGDTRVDEEIFHGWLQKHKGGNAEGPTSASDCRYWFVLAGGFLRYYTDTKRVDKARSEIMLGDITQVRFNHVLSRFRGCGQYSCAVPTCVRTALIISSRAASISLCCGKKKKILTFFFRGFVSCRFKLWRYFLLTSRRS